MQPCAPITMHPAHALPGPSSEDIMPLCEGCDVAVHMVYLLTHRWRQYLQETGLALQETSVWLSKRGCGKAATTYSTECASFAICPT